MEAAKDKPKKYRKSRGGNHVKRTLRQKVRLGTAICRDYGTDLYTISGACLKNGVPYTTWREWYNEAKAEALKPTEQQKSIVVLVQLFKDAREAQTLTYKERVREKSLTSLEKRIAGYKVEERKAKYEYREIKNEPGKFERILVEEEVKEKHIEPSIPAIFYGLGNSDGDAFQNVQVRKNEHSGEINGTRQVHLIKLSDGSTMEV